ncbi:hypothetical protein MCEMRE212_00059 [Candidatus Nanopelagicaceae bacterium]
MLVDIGAGSALFSKELIRTNRVKRSVAVDTGYAEDSEDIQGNLSYRRKINYSGHTHFLLTDVLEHIEDDAGFLRDIVLQADRNSTFIITVPAMMSLWSGHDVYLKHYRRYTKSNLKALATGAGLMVQKTRYTYSTLFPIAYLQRKFAGSNSANSQMKDNGLVVSLILRILLFPDRWISFLPFGISLYLEAIKND